MAESKFPLPESTEPPAKTPSPKKTEFTIATKNLDQLVIQFHVQKTKRLIKIILVLFFLLPIPLIWGGAFLMTGPPRPLPHFTFEENVVEMVSIMLPIFWGLDLIFILIATYMPLTDSFRVDKSQGRVELHSIYPFRKKEKHLEMLIKDIAGLREQRFHVKNNQFYILFLELRNGDRIDVYRSGYLQVIHDLNDIVQSYLPAPGNPPSS